MPITVIAAMLGCSSVGAHLSSMWEALDSIPSSGDRNEKEERKRKGGKGKGREEGKEGQRDGGRKKESSPKLKQY